MLKHLHNSPYEAFIFDCDGTIADTMALYFLAWKTAIRRLGGPADLDWEPFSRNGGRDFRDSIREYNRTFHCNLKADEVLDQLEIALKFYLPFLKPIEATNDFIRQENRRPLAVASSGTRRDVHYILHRLGLFDRFRAVVTADDVERLKPAPDLFLLAAEKLQVSPGKCLVFEDSPLGAEAARLAGMDCHLVPQEWWDLTLLEIGVPPEDGTDTA